MPDDRTRFKRALDRLKDHRVLGHLLVVCLCIVMFVGFVETITKVVGGVQYCWERLTTPSEDELRHQRALAILTDCTRASLEDIDIESLDWIDLTGKGDNQEFCIRYTLDDRSYVDVYSLRPPPGQRLFHEESLGLKVGVATYDDTQYLVAWRIEGPGEHLWYSVSTWDGVGPLRREISSDADDDRVPLSQGDLFIIDGQIYITGGGRKYHLIREDGKLQLQPYKEHPKYPDMGQGCHVLRIRDTDLGLELSFDGKVLVLVSPSDDNDKIDYFPVDPIRLVLGESVRIDDNFDMPRQVRLLGDSNVSWQRSLFPVMSPKSPGFARVIINDSDALWYEVTFVVFRRNSPYLSTPLRSP